VGAQPYSIGAYGVPTHYRVVVLTVSKFTALALVLPALPRT